MAAIEKSDGNTSTALDPPKSTPERCIPIVILDDSPIGVHGLPDDDVDSLDNEAEEERQKKFNKYEAEYSQYLKSKYFSNKTYTGENVFEEETKIENETIRSSRFPILNAFVNPPKYLEEKKNQMEVSISTPGNKQ